VLADRGIPAAMINAESLNIPSLNHY